MKTRSMLFLALLSACTDAASTDQDVDTSGTDPVDCAYPAGAAEPMALNEVLTPYRWPTARHGDGRSLALDLANVPCAADADIDWSPFDALVFVSIPAW